MKDSGIVKTREIWTNIYKNLFHKTVYFSTLSFPEIYNPDKHLAVLVPRGLSLKEVIMVLRQRGAAGTKENHFSIDLFIDDLQPGIKLYSGGVNSILLDNDRNPGKDYFVIFEKSIEADAEWKGISASELKKENIKCITFLERLLLEILSLEIDNRHLDNVNITLCAGSYLRNGHVISVAWHGVTNSISVHWVPADHFANDLRARVLVA